MTILVVGATGATGRLVARQLMERGESVRMIVRSPNSLPEDIRNNNLAEIITANLLDLSDAELALHLRDCKGVVSCLGHSLTFKGIFGKPRQLVTDATRRITKAITANSPKTPVKFVLMNSSGVHNNEIDSKLPISQSFVLALLRKLVPPHADNEKASAFLRHNIGQSNRAIEWVAVRPDSLLNEEEISAYELHPSPIRNAIFNPGATSRINVGAFMANLLCDDELWAKWKGRTPVIYNTSSLQDK